MAAGFPGEDLALGTGISGVENEGQERYQAREFSSGVGSSRGRSWEARAVWALLDRALSCCSFSPVIQYYKHTRDCPCWDCSWSTSLGYNVAFVRTPSKRSCEASCGTETENSSASKTAGGVRKVSHASLTSGCVEDESSERVAGGLGLKSGNSRKPRSVEATAGSP